MSWISHIFSYLHEIGCSSSCMAVVHDPGADILGGDDTPDAPLDPNAPQIRVSTNTKKISLILRHKL